MLSGKLTVQQSVSAICSLEIDACPSVPSVLAHVARVWTLALVTHSHEAVPVGRALNTSAGSVQPVELGLEALFQCVLFFLPFQNEVVSSGPLPRTSRM